MTFSMPTFYSAVFSDLRWSIQEKLASCDSFYNSLDIILEEREFPVIFPSIVWTIFFRFERSLCSRES